MIVGSGTAPDPLHKGTLRFKQHGVGIELVVLEGVFASAGVDAGTRHLLRWLAAERYAGVRTVLDVGCGYGPLGLWLAAADATRSVLAIDRDARAVEATALGAARNGVTDRVDVAGSLGYDEVGERTFDLVVSNIPAKVGPAGLAHLVRDAHHRLSAGGLAAVVVVDRLAEAVAGLLQDDAIDVVATRPTRTYTAFEYRFVGEPASASAAPGFERGHYRRGRATFQAGTAAWDADVAFSIPEFDTLGHGTLTALEVARAPSAELVVVSEVGQGHLPLGLRAAGSRGPLRLVDRDLLALRTAAANLGDEERVECRHRGRLVTDDLAGAALAVLGLPEREPVAVTAAVLGAALRGADAETRVVLHGRTADVSRVQELLPRHGVRLAEDARARRGVHSAIRARVRARRARPGNSVTPPA